MTKEMQNIDAMLISLLAKSEYVAAICAIYFESALRNEQIFLAI
jgi:hypothetical protein